MRGTILMFLSASRASAFMPAARGFLGRTAGMRAAPAAIRVYSSVDDASPEAPPPVAEAAAPAEAAEAPAPAPAGGNDEDASKVYVGNLSFQTSDAELYDLFSPFGAVASAEHVKDKFNPDRKRGFGFVQFATPDEARSAVNELEGTDIGGRTLRVNIAGEGMTRERAPREKRERPPNDGTKIYVGNLDFDTPDDALYDLFAVHGAVVSARQARDREYNTGRGFGFVQFETVDEANKAIAELDGSDLQGRALRVNLAGERPDRPARAPQAAEGTKLYIGNLSFRTQDDDLFDIFSEFGAVVSAIHVSERDQPDRKRGFGFITFDTADAASAAVEAMDGADVDNRCIRVNIAQPSGGGGGGRGGGGGGGYGGGGGGGGGYGGGGGGGGGW